MTLKVSGTVSDDTKGVRNRFALQLAYSVPDTFCFLTPLFSPSVAGFEAPNDIDGKGFTVFRVPFGAVAFGSEPLRTWGL
jgi:hypothetical protein